MPLIKKSSNSIWCVWFGPWKVGQKDNKKKVGVNVAINIRADRIKDFSEESFVREVSELLIKYAEGAIQRDENVRNIKSLRCVPICVQMKQHATG